MSQEKFSFSKRLASFKHAFNGLIILWREEHNARIHLITSILVLGAGYMLDVSKIEWMIIMLTVGFVMVTEILNSAIEYLADHVTPDYHENIKKVKKIFPKKIYNLLVSKK